MRKFTTHLFTAIITISLMGGVINVNATSLDSNSPPAPLSQQADSTPEGWQTFSNPGYGFQISYPPEFFLDTSFDSTALNLGMGVPAATPVWKFALNDESLYQETNLREASLVINVQNTPQALQQCSDFKEGSIYTSPKHDLDTLPTSQVNAITFSKDIVEEGSMGDFYKKIIRRTAHEDACYQITIFLHSLNLDFLPPGSLTTFNEQEIITRVETLLATFEFLDLTPTFPNLTNPQAPVQKTTSQPLGGPNPEEDGIDVSHWQGNITWSQVYGAGYTFAFTKATEGVGYTDNKFVYNITNGFSEGVLMGAYHFARPDLSNGGVAEAQYFVDVAGDYLVNGYLRPVLDLEVRGGLDKTALSTWVQEWMETVRAETGVEPLIYTNSSFITNYLDERIYQYELWIAYWTCDPTPTEDVPPTGPWRDWDFWQYYGPGYCGPNSVPGIDGSVDLNLFNGYLPGLHTFEINLPLAVSLTANPSSAHAPADIALETVVSGTATGDINYTFWWDCEARGLSLTETIAACGDIPTPSPGACAENQNGMKCEGISDPAYAIVHLYETPGEYTAKVITEREGSYQAEDRFQVSILNPLQATSIDPPSPAYAIINEPFQVDVEVDISTSQGGALQVSLINDIPETKDSQCKQIPDNTITTETFSLSFTESEIGLKNHLLWTRFREGEDCPIQDTIPLDQFELYIINWGLPEIDIQRPAGTSLPDNGTDDLGPQPAGNKTLTYTIDNTAGSTLLSVTGVTASSLSNASNFSLNTSTPIDVLPGETETFEISFDVDSDSPFSFNLEIANNDQDEDPYDILVSGTGMNLYPEIDLERPAGTSFPNGGTDNVGDQVVGPATLTYTVDNSAGTAQLTLSDITPSNLANASNFSLDTTLPLSVPAGETGTFDISFTVDATGPFGLDLTIANNDDDENPYNIQVSGAGIAQIYLPFISVGR